MERNVPPQEDSLVYRELPTYSNREILDQLDSIESLEGSCVVGPMCDTTHHESSAKASELERRQVRTQILASLAEMSQRRAA